MKIKIKINKITMSPKFKDIPLLKNYNKIMRKKLKN